MKRKMPSPAGGCWVLWPGRCSSSSRCLSVSPSLFSGLCARAVAFLQLRGISQQVSHKQWVPAKRVCFPESAFSDQKEEIPIVSAHYKWTDWQSVGERFYPSRSFQCGPKKYIVINWPNGRSPNISVWRRANTFKTIACLKIHVSVTSSSLMLTA